MKYDLTKELKKFEELKDEIREKEAILEMFNRQINDIYYILRGNGTISDDMPLEKFDGIFEYSDEDDYTKNKLDKSIVALKFIAKNA